jgi:hypothetical protein
MISYAFLWSNIFSQISTATGYNIYPANINQKLPEPRVVYNIINENMSSHASEIRSFSKNSENEKSTDITLKEKTTATVSINVIGRQSDYDAVRTMAGDVLNWFRMNEVDGALVKVPNTQIQDRTTFLEHGFQQRVGFDIFVDYCQDRIKTIESIETIEVTPTINGEEQPMQEYVLQED